MTITVNYVLFFTMTWQTDTLNVYVYTQTHTYIIVAGKFVLFTYQPYVTPKTHF